MYDLILFPFTTALDLPEGESGWIGLIDFSDNKSDFRWISNNSSLTFFNWFGSQPAGQDQDCGVAVLSPSPFASPAEWFDDLCAMDFSRAVCEADRVSGNS